MNLRCHSMEVHLELVLTLRVKLYLVVLLNPVQQFHLCEAQNCHPKITDGQGYHSNASTKMNKKVYLKIFSQKS